MTRIDRAFRTPIMVRSIAIRYIRLSLQYGFIGGMTDYYNHHDTWGRDGKVLREQGYATELLGAEVRISQLSQEASCSTWPSPALVLMPNDCQHQGSTSYRSAGAAACLRFRCDTYELTEPTCGLGRALALYKLSEFSFEPSQSAISAAHSSRWIRLSQAERIILEHSRLRSNVSLFLWMALNAPHTPLQALSHRLLFM